MTRHEWIWVAIRIFGIFLLVQAITAIPSLISSAFSFHTFPGVIHSGSDSMDAYCQAIHVAALDAFHNALAKLVVCGSIGIYFIKGGGFLFKVICPPSPEKVDKPDA
ncbi:MAG: hypothetical protein LV481_06340 [Methylacidiphilales bacterium]|nr:hypothetical protein [Candidatus Methylacidiphilales bacterium]